MINGRTCLSLKIKKEEGNNRLKYSPKRIFCIALICVSLFLSGCLDSRSPERVSYIQGIGFDYKDGVFTAYLQFVNLSEIAKTEGGGDQEQLPLKVGKSTGKTLDEAVFKLYRSTQTEIYYGTLSFIVVTERLLKAREYLNVIDVWSRFAEVRYQIHLYSTAEDLEEVMKINPVLNISKGMGGLAFPGSNIRQYTFTQSINMREILVLLNEPNYLGYIPSISITNQWKETKKAASHIKFNGFAFYDRDQGFLGTIEGEEISGYRWMMKDFHRTDIVLSKDDKPVGTLVASKKKTKVAPKVKGNDVTFQVNIEVEAHVGELHEQTSIEQLEKLAAKQIKKEVLRTYRTALDQDADFYRLSEKLYRHDVKSWKRLSKKGNLDLKSNDLKVNVDVLIKDSYRDHIRRQVE